MFNWIEYLRFLIRKILSPPIIILTLTGNVLILIFSLIFYFIEAGRNQEIKNLFDAIWWAFSTVTTVGYGDLVPVTTEGRVISILLMLYGNRSFCSSYSSLGQRFFGYKIHASV